MKIVFQFTDFIFFEINELYIPYINIECILLRTLWV